MWTHSSSLKSGRRVSHNICRLDIIQQAHACSEPRCTKVRMQHKQTTQEFSQLHYLYGLKLILSHYTPRIIPPWPCFLLLCQYSVTLYRFTAHSLRSWGPVWSCIPAWAKLLRLVKMESYDFCHFSNTESNVLFNHFSRGHATLLL